MTWFGFTLSAARGLGVDPSDRRTLTASIEAETLEVAKEIALKEGEGMYKAAKGWRVIAEEGLPEPGYGRGHLVACGDGRRSYHVATRAKEEE